jgi:hypothetical protein
VNSTTLGFDAMITQEHLKEDLHLLVTKDGTTPGTTTLSVGGNFAGVLGKASLQVGFAYTQSFGPGNQISRTAAFAGELDTTNGKVEWTFHKTGSTIELAVGVDVKFGDVSADARLNLTVANGEVSGVSVFLGLKF